MISKISSISFRNPQKNACTIPLKSNNNQEKCPPPQRYPLYSSSAYYPLTFTGTNNPKKGELIEKYLSEDAKNIVDGAAHYAKHHKNKEITHYHILKSCIEQFLDIIKSLETGEIDSSVVPENSIFSYIAELIDTNIFSDEQTRKKFKKVLIEESNKLDKELDKLPKKDSKTKLKLSESLINDIYSEWSESDTQTPQPIEDSDLLTAVMAYSRPEILSYTDKFIFNIQDKLMIENDKKTKQPHIKYYDNKAKNVWKNLTLGTNMFVTFDSERVDSKLFIENIYRNISDNPKDKYNKKNTEIIEFKPNVKANYVMNKIKEEEKNKDKNYICLLRLSNLILNSFEANNNGIYAISQEYLRAMKNLPPNIRFIILEPKVNYFNYISTPAMQNAFSDFGEISIPILSTDDFKQIIKEEPLITKDVKKPFSKKALDKVVEASAPLEGIFPEKTIKLMKKIVSYYIDKKEINENDVINYVKEAQEMFKKSDDDSSVNIVFDTGKRIKDIIGKDSTKKEALSIVRQIKSKKMGTKGLLIYSQDGVAGGGRRHTAQAIAGEAHIPYAEINAMDFGTKEVNLFGDTIFTPEASIKKLFSLVNTQAETNPYKSAVLYIENFELFSLGENLSEYYHKTMAQILREMENAQKKGLNILVIGSLPAPNYIGESTMKSYQFGDTIEVASTVFSSEDRAAVIKNSIKQNKFKIKGDTPEEKEAVIKAAADTTMGFPFIYLRNLVKKAANIATERGHKTIEKGDFTEAYLQISTGRPNLYRIEEHEKDLVAKHECGHAITLEVMNEIAKKYGKLWHVPHRVNFITLDPRGIYGGAMFPKEDSNKEFSFEYNFADIVCSYGGHSAEKRFFDMDGSRGITCDLEMATETAKEMVKTYGQGYNTGKISLNEDEHLSPLKTAKIEADMDAIMKNALIVSDSIVETYEGFIEEFAQKYAHLVGSGDCLIDGDTFRKELAEWKAKQSPEKQEEFDITNQIILECIKKAKKSQI